MLFLFATSCRLAALAISFQCPGCQKPYNVADDWGGRACQCGCGATLTVPYPQAATTISFECINCRRPYHLGAEWAGKTSRGECGAMVTVPAATLQPAASSVAGLLDEAFAPRQQAPAPTWEQGVPSPSYSPIASSGYSTAAPETGPRQPARHGARAMPPSVNHAGIGLFGCAGISIIAAVIIFLMMAFVGIDGNNTTRALAVMFAIFHLVLAIGGIACGAMLWNRVPGSIPLCAIAGLPVILGTPPHLIFVIVLYVNLFARDTQNWVDGRWRPFEGDVKAPIRVQFSTRPLQDATDRPK